MNHRTIKEYIQIRKAQGKTGFKLCKLIQHDIISEIVGGCYELACRMHMVTPKVIVMIDGGICSQMHQYLIGQLYAQKGMKVLYDLTWFKVNGMDVDGRYTRVFELKEMYPDLALETSSQRERRFYKKFLRHIATNMEIPAIEAKTAPIYIGAYYIVKDEALFMDAFDRLYNNGMASINEHLNSNGKHTCAIHVRRGDLASGDNPWYGGCSDAYFFKAIETVEKMHPKTKYFFFSDEMEYVETNLTPHLNVDYELVRGPHKAYEDLILISQCDTIVASQGSFGKYASLLNKESMLIVQKDKFAQLWLERKKNAIAI